MRPIFTNDPPVFADHSSRDLLQLLMQSPSVLFAYWRISARKAAMVREHFGAELLALQPSLRVYDTTGLPFDGSAANDVWQLPLPPGESCFLSGMQPGRSYVVDLGIVSSHGHFLPLLRSNCIKTSESADSSPAPRGDSAHLSVLSHPVSLILPQDYNQFSAYSVYAATEAETDMEPGGDKE